MKLEVFTHIHFNIMPYVYFVLQVWLCVCKNYDLKKVEGRTFECETILNPNRFLTVPLSGLRRCTEYALWNPTENYRDPIPASIFFFITAAPAASIIEITS